MKIEFKKKPIYKRRKFWVIVSSIGAAAAAVLDKDFLQAGTLILNAIFQ
jgi:hypothetical protein